jgi:hypothetical protein
MIAHVPDTDRAIDTATEIAVPRPRTGEPRVAPQPQPASDGTRDPFLVAAQLESSAALLTWVVRLALLVAVGLVALVAVL